MNGFGWRMKADPARSFYAACYRQCSGDGPIRRCVSFCLVCLYVLLSPCRFTIRPPSFLQRSLRVIWCVVVVSLATRLTIAEWIYARAWNLPIEQSLSEMGRAKAMYPFQPKFRDGPALRMRALMKDGK